MSRKRIQASSLAVIARSAQYEVSILRRLVELALDFAIHIQRSHYC